MTNLLRTFVWAAVFSVSFCGTGAKMAFAVLGETEAELIKRYGMPTQVRGNEGGLAEKTLIWKNPAGHDVLLIASLIGGRSARQSYILGKAVEEPAADIVKQLLSENGDGWEICEASSLNSLEERKAELTGKEHQRYKYFYSHNKNGNQVLAFILEKDPRCLEVQSTTWREALK